ncbi:MAG: hypothetical protein DHS20C18_33310 [Saprospiraceae bacterium]|nr:MAG: hypothetical protein DHS20C18_33310 [Saprospiraceae bacterium]
MNPKLEARKLNILEYLAEWEDESVIQQIENLLVPNVNFWKEMSEAEKAMVRKGVKDLEEGKKIAYKEFITKYRNSK